MNVSTLEIAKGLTSSFSNVALEEFMQKLNSQEMEWYATFRNYVTDKIEDFDFEELTEDGVKTLLPVRSLAAMIIMQDGFGWGDAQLISECRNDLSIRHALAISETGTVPSASMMNKFRILLSEHERSTGINLMSELTEKLTSAKGPVMKLGTGRIMLWAMRVA
jgi:hypothetical protein